jgi:DNA-directed RNA polymerase specialized sigma24 family protein
MENATSDADVYALNCIRVRIRRLVGQKLIRKDEVEDVCNDVYCKFLKRKHRFDPARGSYSTFISCLIRNRIASVARGRMEFRRRCRFAEYSETALVGALLARISRDRRLM